MPAAPATCVLKVAPTETGCVIRVEGEGTLRESPTARDIALRTLAAAGATVTFDLSACTYLDSTFLGCLMHVYRAFGRSAPPRYYLAGPGEQLQKILGPTHIDRLIPTLPAPPAVCGPWAVVPSQSLEKRELLRHVMECHRVLAESDCPHRATFARIADQIAMELSK